MTYENGTTVLWGVHSNEDAEHDHRGEATVRGFTWLGGTLYYVLEADSKLFVRSHDWVTKVHSISLAEYIGDYIDTEIERYDGGNFTLQLPGCMIQLRLWVEEAIDAYEGGAK